MTVLTAASTQWATRPADQRFTSLTALHAHVSTVRDRSHAKALSSRALTAVPVDGDHRVLAVVGPNGGPVDVTHWAFTQLAQRAGAPAGYLRESPGAKRSGKRMCQRFSPPFPLTIPLRVGDRKT
jgi:hypothetical protein